MPKFSSKIVWVILFIIFAMSFYGSNASASALINLNTHVDSDINTNVEETSQTEEVGEDRVIVKYREHGKLLALIPVTLTITTIAHADGTVEVVYPWYSKLTVDKEKEIENQIRIAVDHTLRSRAVGSVRGEGEVSNPTFTPAESEDVTASIHAVLGNVIGVEGTVD